MHGLVLPHETCATHLNSKHETIDSDLEKKSFKAVGEMLIGIWSELQLDGHPIVSEYVEEIYHADEMWMTNH